MADFCNPQVDTIVGYVEQHRLPLLSRSVLGSISPRYFTLMTGVKGNTKLNIMETGASFTCGETCGWHPSSNTSFSQREMCVLPLNVHASFCDKNLLDTWANYEVKVAAGLKNLPFEEEWTNSIVENVQRNIELSIWLGTAASLYTCSNPEEANTNCVCDGLLESILEEAPSFVNTNNYDPYQYFVNVFNNLPSEVKGADDLIAFVGVDMYYKLIQSIMETSHFHIDGDDLLEGFVFPGTGVRVVATHALDGEISISSHNYKDIIVIGRQSNFFYGTDMRGDEEKFDLWYSKDNREFRLAIEFTMGAAVAFPSEVVIGFVQKP